ncbi:MAG TPA: ABC transporter permease subunit [Actinomycetota bacterium]|nr:ABC transporter permease subunit [Actinomycetota bacterium]
MNLRHVRLVASHDLKDFRRQRQIWFSLFLQPVLLLLILGVVGYAMEQRGNAFRTKEFKALVSGPPEDTAPVERVIRDARFRVSRPSDIERPIVGGDAEVGVRVPPGTAAKLEAGEPVELTIMYLANRDQSEVALTRLRVAFQEFSREQTRRLLATRGLSADLVSSLKVASRDVSTTDRGARLQLSKFIPPLLLFQSISLLSLASNRLSGKKTQRTLEPLLVLPLDRRDILAGAGLSAMVLGAVPMLTFMIPVLVVSSLPIAFASGLSSPLMIAAALVTAAPMIALLTVSIGLALGSYTRGGESGGMMSGLAFIPVLAVGYLFQFVDSIPVVLPLFAAPAFGPVLYAREAMVDGIVPMQLATAAVSTVACSWVLLRIAARLLSSERSVLRGSS